MAQRPGEVVGSESTRGHGLGSQGPDQGYLLKLAEGFEDPIVLGLGERIEDVMAGCCAVALRRASLFGRAPVMNDLRLALELFGFLAAADDELVSWRRRMLAGAAGHHGYDVKLRLADLVPESTLRSTPAAVVESRAENWRTLLGL